jgi:ribonuclease HII
LGVVNRSFICGVDEAGRGPLAGPVYAAAVVLGERGQGIIGINDSKKLSESKRDQLAVEIKTHALAWAIVAVDVETIDRINILQATLLGMYRAVSQLDAAHMSAVVIDGTQIPRDLRPWCAANGISLVARPKADATVIEVGAASILAKTARDAHMLTLHESFPQYGFAKHKGYGTAAHMAALNEHGPCIHHRRSFAPIAQWSLPLK